MNNTINNNSGRKHWGTFCFYLLIGLVVIVLIGQSTIHRCKTVVLNQFHLNQNSFALFAAVHFIPPMYNFANEVWYSYNLMDFKEMEKVKTSSSEVFYSWMNHYPLRLITFGIFRHIYYGQSEPQYVYVRSKFMNLTLKTIYEVKRVGREIVMSKINEELIDE